MYVVLEYKRAGDNQPLNVFGPFNDLDEAEIWCNHRNNVYQLRNYIVEEVKSPK